MTTATMSAPEARERLQCLLEAAETLTELGAPTPEWDAAMDAVNTLQHLGAPAARELDHALMQVRGEHGHSDIGAEDMRDAIRDAIDILDLAMVKGGDDAR